MALAKVELSKESYDYFKKHLKLGDLVVRYAEWTTTAGTEPNDPFTELIRASPSIGMAGFIIQKLIEGKIILEAKQPDFYTVVLPAKSANGYKYVFLDQLGEIGWTNEYYRIVTFRKEQLDVIPKWAKPFINKVNAK